MAPIAVLPLLSVRRCEAASQTCSFTSSSLIQARGLDMIFVKYCGTPSLFIFRFGRSGVESPLLDRGVVSHDVGCELKSARVDNNIEAGGLV